MADQTIYVVVAGWDHQTRSPIKAFLKRPCAHKFAIQCWDHDRAAPECPPIGDSDENNALWASWQKKRDRWARNHPAGENHSADSYDVVPLKLVAGPLDAAQLVATQAKREGARHGTQARQ